MQRGRLRAAPRSWETTDPLGFGEKPNETAFEWTMSPDGDDYVQINTQGVCGGTGEPGINGGIGPSDPGDDFVTFYVQVPDVAEALDRVVELGAEVDLPATEAGAVVIAVFRDPAGNRVGLVRG